MAHALQNRHRPGLPANSRRPPYGTRPLLAAAATQSQPSNTAPLPPSKSIFIFGLGYTSVALGNWLAAEGWNVSGTCRTPSRADGLRAKGWTVDCYDPARGGALTPDLRERLEASPYVLSSIPPMALALYDPALAAQKALLRPLSAGGRLAWFGYLSSTGVYGDWQGEWVDESSPCRQTSSKAIVRQEAEAAWLQMQEQSGLPTHIFRLGGIYGPGRSVLDTLQSKPADLSSSQQRRGRQRYTARCHVADICAVVAASMASPSPLGRVYNIVDDDPVPRSEVVDFARSLVFPAGGLGNEEQQEEEEQQQQQQQAQEKLQERAREQEQQAGVPSSSTAGERAFEPPAGRSGDSSGSSPGNQGPGDSSGRDGQGEGGGGGGGEGEGGGGAGTGRRRRGGGSTAAAEALEEKRVRNTRIRTELGLELRYPTFREGVAAIHSGQWWPLTAADLALL